MDIIYKVLITILSVIILLSTGLSLSLCIADEIETTHYFASVAETLANSHYSENIKHQLITEAEEKDYELDIQILRLVLDGKNYAEISEKCFISESSVKYRAKKFLEITGKVSKQELVKSLKEYYK